VEPLENRRLLSTPSSPFLPAVLSADLDAHWAKVVQPLAAASTKTTIASSASISLLGQSVDLEATVKSGAGVPTGSVEFLNGSTVLATAPVGHAGHASISSNALFLGSYNFTAKFLGSTDFAASQSRGTSLEVELPSLTTLAGGLQIGTVQSGSGKKAKAGKTLSVNFEAFLTTGTIFSNSSQGPISFVLDADPAQVIPGLDEGIAGMEVGEIRDIVIPPSLAYGRHPPKKSGIPKNATLVYVVELVSLS
jgi:hypothetical protein